jgi:hypothetical protein
MLIDTIEIRYRDGTNVFRGPAFEIDQPFILLVGEKLVKIETWVDDQFPGWVSPGQPRLRACNFITDSGRSQWFVAGSGIGGWAVNLLGSAQAPIIDIQRGPYSLSLITGIVQAQVEMRCSVCPAGKFSTTEGATAIDTCLDCAAGKFSAAVGASVASVCADCEAGKFSGATGSSVCANCTAGKYQPTAGVKSVSVRERKRGKGVWETKGTRSREVKKECNIQRCKHTCIYIYMHSMTFLPTASSHHNTT